MGGGCRLGGVTADASFENSRQRESSQSRQDVRAPAMPSIPITYAHSTPGMIHAAGSLGVDGLGAGLPPDHVVTGMISTVITVADDVLLAATAAVWPIRVRTAGTVWCGACAPCSACKSCPRGCRCTPTLRRTSRYRAPPRVTR